MNADDFKGETSDDDKAIFICNFCLFPSWSEPRFIDLLLISEDGHILLSGTTFVNSGFEKHLTKK